MRRSKLISSKKLYFYIVSTLLVLYNLFVISMYASNKLKYLYSVECCQSYYLFTFMLISAVGYTIDMQTKKEACFIILFGEPIFTFNYLFLCLLTGGITGLKISLLILIIGIILLLGYIFYKKGLKKLLGLKMGYHNLVLIYLIVFLTLVLFSGFYLMK